MHVIITWKMAELTGPKHQICHLVQWHTCHSYCHLTSITMQCLLDHSSTWPTSYSQQNNKNMSISCRYYWRKQNGTLNHNQSNNNLSVNLTTTAFLTFQTNIQPNQIILISPDVAGLWVFCEGEDWLRISETNFAKLSKVNILNQNAK